MDISTCKTTQLCLLPPATCSNELSMDRSHALFICLSLGEECLGYLYLQYILILATNNSWTFSCNALLNPIQCDSKLRVPYLVPLTYIFLQKFKKLFTWFIIAWVCLYMWTLCMCDGGRGESIISSLIWVLGIDRSLSLAINPGCTLQCDLLGFTLNRGLCGKN